MNASDKGERNRRRAFRGPVAILGTLLVLSVVTGCAGEPSSSPSTESASTRVFEGTPAEYGTLKRACYEDAGLKTADDPTSQSTSGFVFQSGGIAQGTLDAIAAECAAELGEPKMRGLAETELRERYDARVSQWTCLVEGGMLTGEPITFEAFADQYARSGQKTLWEPTVTATSLQDGRGGPSSVCPRDENVW